MFCFTKAYLTVLSSIPSSLPFHQGILQHYQKRQHHLSLRYGIASLRLARENCLRALSRSNQLNYQSAQRKRALSHTNLTMKHFISVDIGHCINPTHTSPERFRQCHANLYSARPSPVTKGASKRVFPWINRRR